MNLGKDKIVSVSGTQSLEDIRYDRIGRIFCFVKNQSNEEKGFILSYVEYATTAFYLTCQDLWDLERSSSIAINGRSSLININLWFLTIEAFINNLIKAACIRTGQNFERYRKMKVINRFRKFLSLFELDKNSFRERGILARMNEFTQFRNEILHDRQFKKGLHFNHTLFSKNPPFCNQVDVLQSMIICLEVLASLRNVILGVDLMPQIVILKNDSFFYRELDYLYLNLVKPLFLKILKKHDLKSELNLNFVQINTGRSKLFQKGDVKILIRYKPDFIYNLNPDHSDFTTELFDRIKEGIEIPRNISFLPRYMKTLD